MSAAIFIGDELTAAGFRLTGIETIVPAAKDVGGAFDDARARAGLIIITAELARAIPAAALEAARLAETPALAIVPDVRFTAEPPDLSGRLRRVLGIDT
jgi:vacuolar-type H+-ATPase subunit F/Vma7